MVSIQDHPLRYTLANELHARPFPAIEAPGTAVFLAYKPARDDGAPPDRDARRAHLLALLDRFGGHHPAPEATHHFDTLGRHSLKWESHTEFATYTAFQPGRGERPFDPALFDVFPDDWLARTPGERVTSINLMVDFIPEDEDGLLDRLHDWFVPESLAVSRVLDGAAIIATDFRIDSAGHMRMVVLVRPGVGARRIGRIVQRLCEIETYKTMSMLGLAEARALAPDLSRIDADLSQLMGGMTGSDAPADETLKALLGSAEELEKLLVRSSFRFGATGAYEALVHQRVGVLREERFHGRQTFAEFLMRRYDPSMRTVKATERRLQSMAERAMRAGQLLSTRVDVERSAQNQELLAGMNRRADLQLRLQRTVEGLSVVAVSYYAVNLATNIAAPLAATYGLGKAVVAGLLTPPVILVVWLLIRRIRRHLDLGARA
ncbi:DUF3422 domain-containing protein [Rhodobacteraceae bacterium WD3A24]|nr:DUF3422 domain-containing protein [Rhodobacteraceae bacterium WD3A24]